MDIVLYNIIPITSHNSKSRETRRHSRNTLYHSTHAFWMLVRMYSNKFEIGGRSYCNKVHKRTRVAILQCLGSDKVSFIAPFWIRTWQEAGLKLQYELH